MDNSPKNHTQLYTRVISIGCKAFSKFPIHWKIFLAAVFVKDESNIKKLEKIIAASILQLLENYKAAVFVKTNPLIKSILQVRKFLEKILKTNTFLYCLK